MKINPVKWSGAAACKYELFVVNNQVNAARQRAPLHAWNWEKETEAEQKTVLEEQERTRTNNKIGRYSGVRPQWFSLEIFLIMRQSLRM